MITKKVKNQKIITSKIKKNNQFKKAKVKDSCYGFTYRKDYYL